MRLPETFASKCLSREKWRGCRKYYLLNFCLRVIQSLGLEPYLRILVTLLILLVYIFGSQSVMMNICSRQVVMQLPGNLCGTEIMNLGLLENCGLMLGNLRVAVHCLQGGSGDQVGQRGQVIAKAENFSSVGIM